MAAIPAAALWSWDTATTPGQPVPTSFGGGSATKSGATPDMLRQFARAPLQTYSTPPVPMLNAELLAYIREAEDYVEQVTGCLLCPTFVSSPPAKSAQASAAQNLAPASADGIMRLGVDYDREDAGYDFQMDRFRETGWGLQQLRYKPLRNISTTDITAIKSIAFTYPLLTQHFPIPPSWYVEDHDAALVRIVPSANLQMLPLYALQLSIGGFADDLPGGIGIQYTAGLTQTDYASRFGFVRRLVLAVAAVLALTAIQGGISEGVVKFSTMQDGVQFGTEYDKSGPYAGVIKQFASVADDFLEKMRNLVSGPALVML